MTKSNPLLTSFEVGLELGKSARTIQRMADAGDLPVAQKLPGPNGAYLFQRADIERYKRAADQALGEQAQAAS